MSKDACYFSHDSNARYDNKIIKLRSKFGLEGYGFYFCILEIMRDNSDYSVDNDIDSIAYQLQVLPEKIKNLLEFCLELELFFLEEKKIKSNSFLKRMESMDELRAKRIKAGSLGGKAKAKLKQSSSKNVALKEKKEKEKKEKEIKGEETKINKEIGQMSDKYPPEIDKNNNIAFEIITHLNDEIGSSYKATTKKNIELINARLKEGFTLDDFKKVHKNMANKWGSDNDMRQYLRPITLYSPKFESYLNLPQNINISKFGAQTLQTGKNWLESRKKDRENA